MTHYCEYECAEDECNCSVGSLVWETVRQRECWDRVHTDTFDVNRDGHFCDILFIFFVLRYDILRCRLDRDTPNKCTQRRTKTFAFSCKILHKLTLIFIPTERYVTVVTMIGIDVADVHILKVTFPRKKNCTKDRAFQKFSKDFLQRTDLCQYVRTWYVLLIFNGSSCKKSHLKATLSWLTLRPSLATLSCKRMKLKKNLEYYHRDTSLKK